MKKIINTFGLALILGTLLTHSMTSYSFSGSHAELEEEPEKGPHHGRLLKDDDFIIELAVFETGVPPEFRAWITNQGQAINPAEVSLDATLTRLGGVVDHIKFSPQGNFLRGDTVIYEPHSFVVAINANFKGKTYRWRYDNFEGRTFIESEVARALEIGTSIAGPAVLKETISAYGKLTNHPEQVRDITARFEGIITNVNVTLGAHVKQGDPLLTIESNESLKPYTISAPIDGVIQKRYVNPGEQTRGRVLLTIANNKLLVGELAVFPAERHRVSVGTKVWISVKGMEQPFTAMINQIDTTVQPNQSVIVRAEINNENHRVVAGAFLSAKIEVAEYQVPLAVKRSGLQGFRDFTVVYAKVGNEYEVRMLELGREAGEWVEILGGLKPGAEYVSENSYIIKADIEKSGAAHDH